MRGIIVGTGPSLTPEAIQRINQSRLPKFGCNLTYRDVNLDVFYANNKEFWNYYWDLDERLRLGTFTKWTYEQSVSDRTGAHLLRGVWEPSLSKQPGVLHWGHGSGYELLGVAYLHGVRDAILIGYDIRMPPGYDGFQRKIGDGKRNYFGEYPEQLRHWPRFHIKDDGAMDGLLRMYRTIDCEDLGLRIINCSPGSALDFFEVGHLDECI